MAQPEISIVIRAYNEAVHIAKLLHGISSQSVKNTEVILVDSGSIDDTVKIAKEFGCKIISIKKEEFSFGRALNIGCAAASGKILVFASAHVYPLSKDWLERIAAPLAEPEIGISYGMQRPGEANRYSERHIFNAWFPEESAIPQSGYFCNNANCAIRKVDWTNNPYDEDLTGLEDLHWAKRAYQRGFKVAYVAEAPIIHVHEETLAQTRNRYYREALALRQIEDKSHFNKRDFIKLFSLNVLSDLRAAFREKELFRQVNEIVIFRFNQFLGTYNGYRRPAPGIVELRERFYYPRNGTKGSEAVKNEDVRLRIDYEQSK